MYPDWWKGRRFNRPIQVWAAGKTAETTRDIVQGKLLGKLSRLPGEDKTTVLGLGTGLVPRAAIIDTSPKSGISDAIDTAWIQHVSGRPSTLGFKSYGKDRDSFEGTEKDLIWLDEEPPADVYDECGIRLMAVKPGEPNGLMLVTFTPLKGYSEVVKSFLESEDPSKFHIKIGWNDAPHLTEEIKAEMRRKYASQPHLLKTRELGEPGQGEGAIYPVDLDNLLVDPFDIPSHWPRGFGMDVGKTAVVWGAHDKPNDILYLYREYYSEEYNPALHAFAIKGRDSRDAWIPGFVDPAALGSSQVDGHKLYRIYKLEHRLNLSLADNAVEAGLRHMLERMQSGRLKVFRTLPRWQKEFLRYHRMSIETVFGISSKVVKKDDHIMDASRYLDSRVTSMIVKPSRPPRPASPTYSERGWMA